MIVSDDTHTISTTRKETRLLWLCVFLCPLSPNTVDCSSTSRVQGGDFLGGFRNIYIFYGILVNLKFNTSVRGTTALRRATVRRLSTVPGYLRATHSIPGTASTQTEWVMTPPATACGPCFGEESSTHTRNTESWHLSERDPPLQPAAARRSHSLTLSRTNLTRQDGKYRRLLVRSLKIPERNHCPHGRVTEERERQRLKWIAGSFV